MRNSILTLLFLLFVIVSCNKDESVTPTPKAPETSQTQISTTKQLPINNTQINPTQEFHTSILQTQTALLELLTMVLKQAVIQPGLYGLQEGTAETRACPDTNLSGPGGVPADFEKTLILTFNELGSTCNLGGVTYAGELEILFEAALGETDATADSDIKLSIPVDGNGDPGVFTVNGYDFTTDGSIDLTYVSGGTGGDDFVYSYIINDDLTVTNGDIATTIADQSEGTFTLEFEVGDDVNDPIDYLDNPFSLAFGQTQIQCERISTNEQMDLCTKTEEPLLLDPQNCACPVDGILRIKDESGACAPTDDFDLLNSTAYDFGDGTCPGGTVVIQEKIVEFISYEGVITATEEAANGLTSEDIMVAESGSTPVGHSLQLKGTGSSSSDFTWSAPSDDTPGSLNNGQILIASNSSQLPWINEFHYDNASTDMGEFIEIAGPAGLDLSDYELIIYNGNGTSRREQALSGILTDDSNGFGFYLVPLPASFSLQNDDEGFALVKSETTSGDSVELDFCD